MLLSLFLITRFVPESARWLISKGRIQEAKKVIDKAARVNGKSLPEDYKVEIEKNKTVGLRALFSAKYLCVRSLIIFLNW